MKVVGVLPLSIVALFVMSCCVSAAHIEQKEDPREEENIERMMDLPNESEEDPGILETIEHALDPCPGEWSSFEEYCYHVSDAAKTRSEAQKYCDNMDANLVKINSAEENEFVLNLVKKHAPSVKQAWIGLQWEAGPKDFYWFDHSVPTFKNWAPNEPNGKSKEPCGVIYVAIGRSLPYRASGYWNDVPCYVLRANGIVCKKLH